jgi:hypothetical protein
MLQLLKMCVRVGIGKMSLLPLDVVFIPQQVWLILWPKNQIKHLYTQSVQNLSKTETWIPNAVATKPYVKTGRMSNQPKAVFVDDIFVYKVFGKVMAKFHQKPDLYRKLQSA